MAVLGQNWKENNCLRHQSISAPLDGMYGSKAVDKALLEVSSKIGEAKSKKELEFFQRHGFWLWPRTWRASFRLLDSMAKHWDRVGIQCFVSQLYPNQGCSKLFDRPGVVGAFLQSPSSLIHSFSESDSHPFPPSLQNSITSKPQEL